MQFLQELNYSVRLLRKTPLFTALTLIIIVLGLSLYLTSYSIEQILTDKPLPFQDGDRYVSLKTIYSPTSGEGGLSNHNGFSYQYIKDNADSFSSLSAYRLSDYVLSDGDYASTFSGAALEWELLERSAVSPILGRVFTTDDSEPGAAHVTLISETIWRSYYSSDPAIIGRSARINGQTTTIIGVMPQSFQLPIWEELWVPMSVPATTSPAGGIPFTLETPLALIGILKEGVSTEMADREVNALMDQLAATYPEEFSNRTEYIVPFVSLNQDSGFNLGRVMSFITLIILALAVINLTSLLVIRARARQHELAVRSSVGASATELAKQVLLESFLICLLGFIFSLILSAGFIQVLNSLFTSSMGRLPFWFEMSLDMETIRTGGLYAATVWLISGLPIAFQAYRNQAALVLSSTNKGGQKTGRSVITRFVVGTEVILSFFLLICCGVTLYMADRLTNGDYGLETESHMIASINLNHPDYQSDTARINYTQSLIQRVSEIPEVAAAAIATAPPGKFGRPITYSLDDRDLAVAEQLPPAQSIWVSDQYFGELEIEITAGREFSGDTESSAPVVIITETLAELLWPGESALGKRIGSNVAGSGDNETEWLTIIGIVPTILQSGFNLSNLAPSIYRPLAQNTPTDFYLVTRFESNISPVDLERELRLASGNVDRNIAVDGFLHLDRDITIGQSGIDVLEQIFLLYSLATFVLAGVGIYGVIARSIAMQTNEIGVRRALGSADLKIVTRYLKQGALFLSVGILIGGVAATLAVSNVFSSLPVPTNIVLAEFFPSVLLVVIASMGVLIFAASYVPARKAIEMEPGDALRYE